MDSRPTRFDGREPHPVQGEVERALCDLDWVEDWRIQEVVIVPVTNLEAEHGGST